MNTRQLLVGLTILPFLSDMASANVPVGPPPECPALHKVVVVGGTHGNEYTGVWCIKALARRSDELAESFPSLNIETLLSHPEAHMANKRFIDTDLNREFTEEKLVGAKDRHPTVESLRAQELNKLLGPKLGSKHLQTDVIVDLHTTTSNMGTCLIVPEGDVPMVRAAAYVAHKCGGEKGEARILVHSMPRNQRPDVKSIARHGLTIEVGPVPQGVLRHDAVEKTEKALHFFLEYLDLLNKDKAGVINKLKEWYSGGKVPVYRSAKASAPGEMSGKIQWPSDPENPNFPQVLVHKSIQDRDFHKIKKGDPLFIDLNGKVIPYSGSHGEEVYLMFVNEGGYYYSSSGTGISVSILRKVRLDDGMVEE
mmetsp:Transcript_68551/g.101857  ORF Transcript_68551/g.101857 Transcript_68551/m.101857 type:complete len:366 (+) Transcript_68551:2-1099(+)